MIGGLDTVGMAHPHVDMRALLARMLSISNVLGLPSDEYPAPSKRLVETFPRALTHIGVVNPVLGLCGPTMQRGGG